MLGLKYLINYNFYYYFGGKYCFTIFFWVSMHWNNFKWFVCLQFDNIYPNIITILRAINQHKTTPFFLGSLNLKVNSINTYVNMFIHLDYSISY